LTVVSPLLLAVAVFAGTVLVTWALTPVSAAIGLRLGLVDLPSSRRTRVRAVPTTGGIVVFLGLAASIVVALVLYGPGAPDLAPKVVALLLGGTIIVLLGMIDDKINLRPRVKVIVQVAVAALMVVSGVEIERVRFFFGPVFHLGWLGYPLTVAWFVGFMNALNLIDGLDGLAGGIAAIASAGLVAVGVINENPLLYVPAAGLLGSSLGFLFHNFREGNVYLGDAGSMVLGFFLAGGAIIGAANDGASKSLLIAAACMAVPAFDVTTTIVRRRRSRRAVMTPDRSHTHHRLIRFGLNPKMAVLVLWGVTAFFGMQLLSLFTAYGLLCMLASYGLAVFVGKTLATQRRKNAWTTERDLRDEVLYLAGIRDTIGPDDTRTREMSLRDMIVEQIRREALYRRLRRIERAEGKTPVR
jgi:UDP-GlcNAc:undecaprenyl-phosphate/decaprenyl-phosphate GlcNAc-1-phosphate transferase